jgi:ERF superfamily
MKRCALALTGLNRPARPTKIAFNEEIAMEVDKTDLEAQLRASLDGARDRGRPVDAAAQAPIAKRVPRIRKAPMANGNGCAADAHAKGSVHPNSAPAPIANGTSPVLESCAAEQLTLRRKLGEVRRRIGYIQKRGYNERHNYNYVAAADIAGSVGDILAELGVVVIPRLESITYEPHAPGRVDSVRVARVIMAYTFTDENSGEEITAKVAGEGLDAGDKASYKAMTGALKYALLQSFLLATGDDPEDERADSRTALGSENPITAEQVCQLQGLIEETGTELERVLAYYKISALGEMTEACYRRALELLRRKLDKQSQAGGAHAQN